MKKNKTICIHILRFKNAHTIAKNAPTANQIEIKAVGVANSKITNNTHTMNQKKLTFIITPLTSK